MAMALLESLMHRMYETKFEQDTKEPSFLFDTPNGESFALKGVDPLFWFQLFSLVALETVVNVVAAVVIFTYIVKRRGSATAYLVGYGIICPVLLLIPFYLIHYLDLRNTAFKVGTAASPALLFFRCIESMYGTAPVFATQSMSSFIMYYVATVQFRFDHKTQKVIPALRAELFGKAIKCIALVLQVTMLFSILIPYNYQIFPRRDINNLLDLFYWGNICNNYLMAALTSCCLDVGSTGVGLVISLLSGISTIDLNDNPLTRSSSPSDFWGRRWNRLNSSSMKRGVYMPMCMAGFSRRAAALATFAASGLLHEYILVVMSTNTHNVDSFQLYGSHLAFFLWNGVVLVLEHNLFKGHRLVQWIKANLPAPIRTLLVLLTVLPVAMLFTQAYIDNGFYSDFAIGFPRVVRL